MKGPVVMRGIFVVIVNLSARMKVKEMKLYVVIFVKFGSMLHVKE